MGVQIITIKHILRSQQSNLKDVLPFYAYSFEQLVPNQDYIVGYGYNKSFQQVIHNFMKDICDDLVPDYYYDLRNWEDFSCAAPQYMILDELGWNKTKPVSLKVTDQVDVYLALEHFYVCSQIGSTACVTLSNENASGEEYLIILAKNSDEPEGDSIFLTDFSIKPQTNYIYLDNDDLIGPWLNMHLPKGRIMMENRWFCAMIHYTRGEHNAV